MIASHTRKFMAMVAIAQHFGRPATPTDQAWIESLNGTVKAEWPHLNTITDPAVLRAELDDIRTEYNGSRLPSGIALRPSPQEPRPPPQLHPRCLHGLGHLRKAKGPAATKQTRRRHAVRLGGGDGDPAAGPRRPLHLGTARSTVMGVPCVAKILAQMRANPSNIRYEDLAKVCEHYFGPPRTSRGSHAVFKTPWPGDPGVNIQNDHGKAKPYQVRRSWQRSTRKR
ncbi:integrase core domain-containing protein [Ornithinimicrobium panacihumi]|uniref:integrase core domain-containing protein n=1 Tax=Ornithinimicrobium panacihumi TaxID=2008449 RepID=UPI003F8C6E2B